MLLNVPCFHTGILSRAMAHVLPCYTTYRDAADECPPTSQLGSAQEEHDQGKESISSALGCPAQHSGRKDSQPKEASASR
jgi:hypothetical protein